MNSQVYFCTVSHSRHHPFQHSFRYPYLMAALDLAELGGLDSSIPLFGYNRPRPYCIYDRDYTLDQRGSIDEKVRAFILEHVQLVAPVSRIVLLTAPKAFRVGFNPVSFYYCYSVGGDLVCVLAEVNNTFGERHVYSLLDLLEGVRKDSSHFTTEKVFHVSPFITREGTYSFEMMPLGDRLDIRVNLSQEGRLVLSSRLVGDAKPFDSRALFRGLRSHSFSRMMTLPRIHKQAAVLYYRKKASFTSKPPPGSEMTISLKRPRVFDKLALFLVERFMRGITKGGLALLLPNGDERRFGAHGFPNPVKIRIHDLRVFRKTLLGGDVAFGEAFMQGLWDSSDLPGVITLFLQNRVGLGELRFPMAKVRERVNAFRHRLRRNTIRKSRRNIEDHYDLSNAFFEAFLDPTMTYSCAVFENANATLEEAQRTKLQRVIAKAEINPNDAVLEIGCGWGSFAAEVQSTAECRLTATTLSENQYQCVMSKSRNAMGTGRFRVLRSDYRELDGEMLYDRIVAIEMLEAVGHEYLGTFFQVCNRLLKRHGRIVLQVITIPDKYYDSYRRGCDWIQKHVFPGGFLPSLGALEQAVKENSSLAIDDVEDIGIHYAWTLREWRERFTANRQRILGLGFTEEFFRKFVYYFSYCEAAFATRTLGVQQIVLSR